jgi:protease PrsW
VPVTAVVWYLDHDPSPALSPRRILTAFLVGGTIGVLGASLLEYWLVQAGLLGTFEVGLIEEFVKGVFIVVVALGTRRFHIRDGMVLGATVGFGFAAFESSGYALASLFVVQGHQLILSLTSVVFTELVRGVLAPFGHGMWSAILGGVIFAAARRAACGSRGRSWGPTLRCPRSTAPSTRSAASSAISPCRSSG